MDMQLCTGPGVLCPREETELLCQTAANALGNAPCHGLDLCAGTGAVALGLHRLCPNAAVTAVEISEEAAAYCKKNIETYGENAVNLVMGDVLSSTFAEELVEKPLDFILSNPPYIASHELPGLQAEVQQEPALALDGGEDGLVFYRAILTHWAPRLPPAFLPVWNKTSPGWIEWYLANGCSKNFAEILLFVTGFGIIGA